MNQMWGKAFSERLGNARTWDLGLCLGILFILQKCSELPPWAQMQSVRGKHLTISAGVGVTQSAHHARPSCEGVEKPMWLSAGLFLSRAFQGDEGWLFRFQLWVDRTAAGYKGRSWPQLGVLWGHLWWQRVRRSIGVQMLIGGWAHNESVEVLL